MIFQKVTRSGPNFVKGSLGMYNDFLLNMICQAQYLNNCGCEINLNIELLGQYKCLGPDYVDSTSSRPFTEVKQH